MTGVDMVGRYVTVGVTLERAERERRCKLTGTAEPRKMDILDQTATTVLLYLGRVLEYCILL